MRRGWLGVVVWSWGSVLGCQSSSGSADEGSSSSSATDAPGPEVSTSSGEGSGATTDSDPDSDGPDPSGDSSTGPAPNEPPVALADAAPRSGLAPLTVALDGSHSSDPDGQIVEYAWELGDGGSAMGSEVSASIETAGCHDIVLTVTDDDGATAEAVVRVAVVEEAAAMPIEATVDVAPLPSAVLPRDLDTDEGTAHFAGAITSVGYGEVRARVARDGRVVHTSSVPLCGRAPFAFEIDVPIPSELQAFDVQLVAASGDVETPIYEVSDLVAGDIYLINGQSNAYAAQYDGDANGQQTPFIRSYGSNVTDGGGTVADVAWHVAQGNGAGGAGGIGQWAIRMANELSTEHQTPIAVMNGSLGGQPISYFQRDDAEPTNLATNYGRLLTRMQAAGIFDDVRAVLWYQGESDAEGYDVHLAGFEALLADWEEDYPGRERSYVTQIRAGCGGDLIRTQEVQRQLADDVKGISVMSTTALDGHDGCHYAYVEGYEELGTRYADLLGRDLYGERPASDVQPPNPDSARFENGGTEVVITLRNEDSAITFDAGAEADFRLEGVEIAITGGVAEGNELRLTLAADGSAATGVSYLGHVGAGPWVTNENGIGLLEFWNLPVR